MSRLPRALLLLLKPVLQAIAMLWLMLFRAPRPDVVLLQLPPTVCPPLLPSFLPPTLSMLLISIR